MTILLRMPRDSAPRVSQWPSAKRLPASMSRPLDQGDRVFWAVERRVAGVVLQSWRHDAVPKHLPVAFVVVTEQARGEVVAAPVPLAAAGVDPHLHQGFSSQPRP